MRERESANSCLCESHAALHALCGPFSFKKFAARLCANAAQKSSKRNLSNRFGFRERRLEWNGARGRRGVRRLGMEVLAERVVIT